MITLKKSLAISVFIHLIIFSLGALNIFVRPRMVQWSLSPVELMDISPRVVKEEIPKPVKREKIKKEATLKPEKIFKRIEKAAKSLSEKLNISTKQPPRESSPTPQNLPLSVSIDTEKFPFNYYLDIIRNKINQSWNPQRGTGTAEVIVFFKILRHGAVRDVAVEKSSGISFLDQSAVRAIINSDPFPSLPIGFSENYLGVHLTFKVEEFDF